MTLRRLERSADFQVAEGSSDIRGWPLYDGGGEKVGRIDGLLFDPDALEVRYAIADVWDHTGIRRVLVPVGQIQVNEEQRRVLTTTHDRAQLMALQEYDERTFNEHEEKRHLRDYLPRPHREAKTPERTESDYGHSVFRENLPETIQVLEERLRLNKHETQLGEVTVTKQPILEMVEQDVEVQRERVEVKRHQVRRPAKGDEGVTIDGNTIRIPILGEEIVVERRPIVIEEIEITKVPYTTIEKIREELRREEVSFGGTQPVVETTSTEDSGTFMAAEPDADEPRIDLHDARNPGGHKTT